VGCDEAEYPEPPDSSTYVVVEPLDACTPTAAAQAAAAAGFSGVIVVQAPDAPLEIISSADDIDALDIVATMVPSETKEALLAAPNATLGYDVVPGFFGSLSAGGRLYEVGWEKLPVLSMLMWHAQWLEFKAQLVRAPASGGSARAKRAQRGNVGSAAEAGFERKGGLSVLRRAQASSAGFEPGFERRLRAQASSAGF
jgi:hypothetical protein